MTKRMRITALITALVISYLASVAGLHLSDSQRIQKGMDEVLYLPNEKLLIHFTAGLNTVIADLLWLHCIQYTAHEHRGQRLFTWLEHMLTTATRLDPYFVDVYRFGVMFLAALRADPEASLKLARAGIAKNPHSWQLPYEAAMVYLLNKRNEESSRYLATKYLSLSAATGNAPGGIVNLTAKLQDEFNLLEVEQGMWQDMLSSEDAFLRELADRKLKEIALADTCRILNERLQQFRSDTGRTASSLDELVSAKLIRYLPSDPLGGSFFLGSDGIAYNTSLLEDRVIRSRNILINALDAYNQEYNSYPQTLDLLVEKGMLEEVPVHPFPGKSWNYDSQTGTVE